jgi:hypothetical protein
MSNIYGNLINESEVIIGAGSFNDIHALLTYYPYEDRLLIQSLPDVYPHTIISFTLKYENTNSSLLSFSMFSSKYKKYLNIVVENINNRIEAFATLSDDKSIFNVDISSIDNKDRKHLLAGALYSIKTNLGEQSYVVNWKIKPYDQHDYTHSFNNTNKVDIGDMIAILPVTWYESDYLKYSGIDNLVDRLHRLSFKGYTEELWVEKAKNITYCDNGEYCGECMGRCKTSNEICVINNSKYSPFVCAKTDNIENEQSQLQNQQLQLQTQQTNDSTIIIVVILIMLVVMIVTFGILLNKQATPG